MYFLCSILYLVKYYYNVFASKVLLNFNASVSAPLCGKFKIFLALRFYVKSILENQEVLKLPFFAILQDLNCVGTFQPSK